VVDARYRRPRTAADGSVIPKEKAGQSARHKAVDELERKPTALYSRTHRENASKAGKFATEPVPVATAKPAATSPEIICRFGARAGPI
jgi:hypothetical protein